MILLSPQLDATLENPAIELNEHEDVMLTVERLSNAAKEYAANDNLEKSIDFADVRRIGKSAADSSPNRHGGFISVGLPQILSEMSGCRN